MEVEELLQKMHYFFNNIDNQRNAIQQDIKIKEDEQQDLLHELELSNLDAVGMMKVAKRLKVVRQERRILKNDLERVNTIKGFTDKYNNKFIIADISQALKNLETLEKNQNNRKYTPRVLEDLTIVKEDSNEGNR